MCFVCCQDHPEIKEEWNGAWTHYDLYGLCCDEVAARATILDIRVYIWISNAWRTHIFHYEKLWKPCQDTQQYTHGYIKTVAARGQVRPSKHNMILRSTNVTRCRCWREDENATDYDANTTDEHLINDLEKGEKWWPCRIANNSGAHINFGGVKWASWFVRFTEPPRKSGSEPTNRNRQREVGRHSRLSEEMLWYKK